MRNYFNYFTEIEEHFQRARGAVLLLSTLDWALIETWREAEIPLEAVLRGIDTAFEKYNARSSRARMQRVNGLAYCAQAVLEAAEDMKAAAVGQDSTADSVERDAGYDAARVSRYLHACAESLRSSPLNSKQLHEISLRLDELAAERGDSVAKLPADQALEILERNLTVLEEKMFAALTTDAPEAELMTMREQAAREMAPFRSRMKGAQLKQVEQQFLHKRLLDRYKVPRLSLFYMSHE